MTAPTRERPHGYSRYRRGCRCDICRAERGRYERKVGRARVAGTWQPFVDAEPVREHLQALLASGIGYRRISALSGTADSVIRAVLHGWLGRPPRKKIRPSTAAKILALPADPSLLAGKALVSAVGVQRRVQALACIGWSLAAQAGRLGYSPQNVSRLMYGQAQVTRRTEHTIKALYDELSMTPAPASSTATRSRNDAARKGWFGPLAWDDDTIDDPDAHPAVMPPTGLIVPGADELAIQKAAIGYLDPRLLNYPTRLEWIARMRRAGHTGKEIGLQLGLADTTVLEMAKRAAYLAKHLGQRAEEAIPA